MRPIWGWQSKKSCLVFGTLRQSTFTAGRQGLGVRH
jgi:hypothetical protein